MMLIMTKPLYLLNYFISTINYVDDMLLMIILLTTVSFRGTHTGLICSKVSSFCYFVCNLFDKDVVKIAYLEVCHLTVKYYEYLG